ncbi:hypothetical protein RAJCM14343_3592 [Rhodococcus aetherivorans]|uniref:Mobile element protein n=1 Tax=Rhodococcus aetherivorans TaxID=191292 RepID=A0ABQ0YPJ4_9NOCA|nr:hypothetical protein RAJCM14343_3592 [Rhodococcus aetherivorans]
MAGIMFVLRTNIAWRDVPAEKIGCSGVWSFEAVRASSSNRTL